jgi:phage terminase large subunit
MKGYTKVSTGYTPRLLQAELHKNLKRFNVLVMHRRFGKTVFAINEMIDKALRNPLPRPQYAYLAPTYGQAKRIAWEYLKQYTANIPGADANEADLRVDVPRPQHKDHLRLQLLGAENPMALKGIYLDGVIPDEYGEMKPSVWSEVIRPTLSDRKGWAIFLGTPKGRNDFYKKYSDAITGEDPEWFGAMFKASETGILDAAELASARKAMSEEEYEQEYECSFNAGLVGAYFAKELSAAEKEGRIGKISHDPMLPVDTYWDLGINDVTSIWYVQSFRRRHRILRYQEFCGIGIPELVAQVRNTNTKYSFGRWVFPHDAKVRDFSTGKERLQVFDSLGCRPNEVIPRVGTKMDSINAARMILPACEFDAEGCKVGLDAIAEYQRKWNSKNEVFEEAPLHNWASNGADAFQCFAMGAGDDSRNSYGGTYYDGARPLVADTTYDPFNWRASQ